MKRPTQAYLGVAPAAQENKAKSRVETRGDRAKPGTHSRMTSGADSNVERCDVQQVLAIRIQSV